MPVNTEPFPNRIINPDLARREAELINKLPNPAQVAQVLDQIGALEQSTSGQPQPMEAQPNAVEIRASQWLDIIKSQGYVALHGIVGGIAAGIDSNGHGYGAERPFLDLNMGDSPPTNLMNAAENQYYDYRHGSPVNRSFFLFVGKPSLEQLQLANGFSGRKEPLTEVNTTLLLYGMPKSKSEDARGRHTSFSRFPIFLPNEQALRLLEEIRSNPDLIDAIFLNFLKGLNREQFQSVSKFYQDYPRTTADALRIETKTIGTKGLGDYNLLAKLNPILFSKPTGGSIPF